MKTSLLSHHASSAETDEVIELFTTSLGIPSLSVVANGSSWFLKSKPFQKEFSNCLVFVSVSEFEVKPDERTFELKKFRS